MKQLKVAYFNQLGRKDLDKVKKDFERKHPDVKVELVGTGYDEAINQVREHKADLAVVDLREKEAELKSALVGQKAIVAMMQKGSYPSGIQMIEKSDLSDLTCFIVAKPEEEAAELHLFKDIYQLPSPFIASNSVEEAALLVASGSGYFLMNEVTAAMLRNDSLQKLFLLDHGQQMWQKIMVYFIEDSKLIQEFVELLKE